jgi:hypothetical protein
MLANNALTTLEQAKKHLGIDASDTTQDDTITFYINSASSLIQKYCNRVFAHTRRQEYVQGRGGLRLVLDHYPITELHGLDIAINNIVETIDVSTIRVIPETGMLYRANGGFPYNRITGQFMHPNFDNPVDNIFIDYSTGYVLPKDATDDNPRTLPYDLEMACLKMIAHMKRDTDIQKGEGKMILKSESIGDWSASYEQEVKLDAKSTQYMSPDVISILCEYKKSEFDV